MKILEKIVDGISNVRANLIYMKKIINNEELPVYPIYSVGSRSPEYWGRYRKEKRQAIIRQIKNNL